MSEWWWRPGSRLQKVRHRLHPYNCAVVTQSIRNMGSEKSVRWNHNSPRDDWRSFVDSGEAHTVCERNGINTLTGSFGVLLSMH